MTGRPILTAAAMHGAEQAAIDSGTSAETLMERAGEALAEAIFQYAGNQAVLFACGPGNNGGDGYVAAGHLRKRGIAVRVAALAEPATDACKRAQKQWGGWVEELAEAKPAAVLVDCLFGTGLKRPLGPEAAGRLNALADGSRITVACDLPSGVDSDSGALLSAVPACELTVAFGALKPSHRLMPAMPAMGRVVLADIGIEAGEGWFEIGAPGLPQLRADAHKYSRGLVHALSGKMPGAIALAANAAARAGAGYVRVSTSRSIDNLPSAIVQTDTATLEDRRIGCVLVGPGMGDIPQLLTLALTAKAPVEIGRAHV